MGIVAFTPHKVAFLRPHNMIHKILLKLQVGNLNAIETLESEGISNAYTRFAIFCNMHSLATNRQVPQT